MSEKLVGHCPHCGNEIEIPAHLQEFSCLYCGRRSHIDLLRNQQDFHKEDLEALASQLPGTLREYKELYKHITKKDYVKYFAQYEKEHSTFLRRLDCMVSADPQGVEAASETVCRVFLDTLDKDLQADKRYGRKNFATNVLFEIKVVLALFLSPLVRKLHLCMAEPFRNSLLRQWLERYPGENWTPGDYDVIAGGFRKGNLCYITTAVCLREGKADDCEELQILRRFRDGWLRENGGEGLIEQYYDLAPSLVTLMDHCTNAEACYDSIRHDWIDPCLSALSRGEEELCRDIYVDMVRHLQAKYGQFKM